MLIVIIRLYHLVDKTSNWLYIKLFKSEFKASGRLTQYAVKDPNT